MGESGSSSDELAGKRLNIRPSCRTSQDLSYLRSHTEVSRGLLNDETRRKVWPILLHCSLDETENFPLNDTWRDLPPHNDELQVRLDVNRAFVFYPKGENEVQLNTRKQQLSDVIVQVLRRHPQLNYFQGYHDIAQVLLLVLDKDVAARALAHLSFLHIRDFMLPSLAPSITQLNLVPSILEAVHPKLFRHLSATQPMFAMSATLTMYAHHIQEFGEIARLFDFLLAQPAVLSLYLFVTIISSRSEELFEIEADDPAILHSTLSKLPPHMDLDKLIMQTIDNFRQHPPESFPAAWWRISSHSALKTTRWGSENWSIADGEGDFNAQSREADRRDVLTHILLKTWKLQEHGLYFTLAFSLALLSLIFAMACSDSLDRT